MLRSRQIQDRTWPRGCRRVDHLVLVAARGEHKLIAHTTAPLAAPAAASSSAIAPRPLLIGRRDEEVFTAKILPALSTVRCDVASLAALSPGALVAPAASERRASVTLLVEKPGNYFEVFLH